MRFWCIPVLFLVQSISLWAQPRDFNSIVGKLSEPDKQQMLAYLRKLGLNADSMLQQAYASLGEQERTRAEAYVNFLALPPDQRPRTKVQWNTDTLFFDPLDEGQLLIDSFRVTNTGKNPYVIQSVRANCDCTVLHFPQYPVMPGESAVVRFEFNSGGKAGKVTAGLIVYDNSRPNARSILYIRGRVIPKRIGRFRW